MNFANLSFFFVVKIDKIYLDVPSKIAVIDHEKKRTYVIRKDGLPDTGKFTRSLILFSSAFIYLVITCIFPNPFPPCSFMEPMG